MVSVIIPTYGGGNGLEGVIESILNQSYKDVEIIVVDDNGCGTENQKKTAEVLSEYIKNEKVKYIVPENNGGGSAARNRGARASKGEYLMFLDDDDTVSSDKIEKQVKALSDPTCKYGISYCSTKVYADGKLSNVISAKKSGDILYKFLMGKVYMGTGTALMIRDAWESLGGYDESFVRHQDWEFFARVLDKYNAVAVPDAYFNRFITNRNLPKKIEVIEKHTDHYISFLKHYKFHISNDKIRNVINMNNARLALLCIRERDFSLFAKTLSKHDNLFIAYLSFLRFCFSVLIDKIFGKKS